MVMAARVNDANYTTVFLIYIGHLEKAIQACFLHGCRDSVSLEEHCAPNQCQKYVFQLSAIIYYTGW